MCYDNYTFEGLTVRDTVNGASVDINYDDDSINFIMPASNVTISVVFTGKN